MCVSHPIFFSYLVNVNLSILLYSYSIAGILTYCYGCLWSENLKQSFQLSKWKNWALIGIFSSYQIIIRYLSWFWCLISRWPSVLNFGSPKFHCGYNKDWTFKIRGINMSHWFSKIYTVLNHLFVHVIWSCFIVYTLWSIEVVMQLLSLWFSSFNSTSKWNFCLICYF